MADFSLWLEFIDQLDMIFIFLKNYNILSKNERNLYFCNNDILELANGITWNRNSNPPCSKMGQLMFESICLLSYHRSTHYRWARCSPTPHFNFWTKQTDQVSNIRDIAFYVCSEIIRIRNFTFFTET